MTRRVLARSSTRWHGPAAIKKPLGVTTAMYPDDLACGGAACCAPATETSSLACAFLISHSFTSFGNAKSLSRRLGPIVLRGHSRARESRAYRLRVSSRGPRPGRRFPAAHDCAGYWCTTCFRASKARAGNCSPVRAIDARTIRNSGRSSRFHQRARSRLRRTQIHCEGSGFLEARELRELPPTAAARCHQRSFCKRN